MEKTFICDVPEKDSEKFLGTCEMKNTLESLARILSKDNELIKEESSLYERLITDYKEIVKEYDLFWNYYFENYGYLLDEDTQFSIDFNESKIFIVPVYSQ